MFKGNHTDSVAPVNEVLSEILSKGHVMHMIFALKPKSPQNQEDYVTEVLSGRLRLFQKEFISSPMIKNNETKVISTKASAIKTCWNGIYCILFVQCLFMCVIFYFYSGIEGRSP